MIIVTEEDFLWYVDLALGEMTRILSELGDDKANRRPALPGANSPFAILTHCLGVLEYWGGATIAGRTVQRDRAAEFRAEGAVTELVERTAAARRRLGSDLAALDSGARPIGESRVPEDMPYGRTQAGVALHVLEELFQHLGQMELTRDVLCSPTGGNLPAAAATEPEEGVSGLG